MTPSIHTVHQEAAEASHASPHWVSRAAFPIVSTSLFLTQIVIGWAIARSWYWLVVPLTLLASHLMHGILIGFHEASHGLLRKSRKLNDLDGLLIGIFSFMSFTLYRAAHQTHHMHLATEQDEELWPFVLPGTPRWSRILAAVLELTFGIFFTPFLFIRAFLRTNSPIRAPKVRRRIWMEFALVAVVWIGLLSAVAWFGVWEYFLWIYAIPAFIAANLQSWRKYIEHVGMTGCTPNSATRSIVSNTFAGKFVSLTLLHEPFHGVHHKHAGVGHAELPRHADSLLPTEPGDVPPFPSYRHALLHLLHTLRDPQVGPQWQGAGLPPG
jgi:fatty acid desaturase